MFSWPSCTFLATAINFFPFYCQTFQISSPYVLPSLSQSGPGIRLLFLVLCKEKISHCSPPVITKACLSLIAVSYKDSASLFFLALPLAWPFPFPIPNLDSLLPVGASEQHHHTSLFRVLTIFTLRHKTFNSSSLLLSFSYFPHPH